MPRAKKLVEHNDLRIVKKLEPQERPLSLLDIDLELLDLFETYEFVVSSNERPEAEAFKELESKIDQYMLAKAKKVDAISTTFLSAQSALAIVTTRLENLTRMRNFWQRMVEGIKRSLVRTMLVTGDKEYITATHRISLRANGGLVPLEASLDVLTEKRPDLVKCEVTMSLDTFNEIMLNYAGDVRKVKAEVDNSRTRIALASGPVEGAQLLPRGFQVRIDYKGEVNG